MNLRKNSKSIKLLAVILPLIVLGSAFSSIRLSSFGVFELLIFIFFIVIILNFSLKKNSFVISKYWGLINIVMILSSMQNLLFRLNEGAINSIPFDFVAYIFMLIWVFSLEAYYDTIEYDEILKIIEKLVKYTVILIFIFYLMSRRMKFIFGLPLFYYYRFAPLSHNPAFVGYLMYPIPWLSYYISTKQNSRNKKVEYFIYSILAIFPILATHNDIGYITLVVSVLVLILLKVYEINHLNLLLLFLIFLGLVIFLLLNFDLVLMKLDSFFIGADDGARLIIWKNGLINWKQSPIIGVGYGPQSKFFMGKSYELHNIYLTILLQSGVIGIIIYLLMLYKVYFQIRKDKILILVLFCIVFPGVSGTPIRKVTTWFYLTTIYYIGRKLQEEDSIHLKDGY